MRIERIEFLFHGVDPAFMFVASHGFGVGGRIIVSVSGVSRYISVSSRCCLGASGLGCVCLGI